MSNLPPSAPSPDPELAPDRAEPPDPETRRRAAAVLEVLAGAKTPAEAAEALSISIARYYLLEARALEGLVVSCEPRPRGRASFQGRSLVSLKKENDRLRTDLSRTQALARAIQRTTGLPENARGDAAIDGRSRRRRRPQARALRAARNLVPPPAPSAPPPREPSAPQIESPS